MFPPWVNGHSQVTAFVRGAGLATDSTFQTDLLISSCSFMVTFFLPQRCTYISLMTLLGKLSTHHVTAGVFSVLILT